MNTNTYFFEYLPQILVGFCIGIFFAFFSSLSVSPELFKGDITLPFQASEAGLDTKIEGSDAITEAAPDNGAEGVVDVMSTVFFFMKIFLGILAFAWIVWAGVFIVSNSGDEENVKKGKRMAIYSFLGLCAMLLIEPLVLDVFYGGGNISLKDGGGINNITDSSRNFRTQVDGIIAFGKTLLVFIAMVYIIFAGARIILAFGDDEQLGSAKQMFAPIIVGILVILFNEVIIDEVIYNAVFDGNKVNFSADSQNASAFMLQLVGFFQYLFEFVGFLVLGFIIYGGFMYLFAFGNEETAENGKKIFIRALIGLLILVFSYILTVSLVDFTIF